MRYEGGDLMTGLASLQEEEERDFCLSTGLHQGKASEDTAGRWLPVSGNGPFSRTKSASALILTSQPAELGEVKACCLSSGSMVVLLPRPALTKTSAQVKKGGNLLFWKVAPGTQTCLHAASPTQPASGWSWGSGRCPFLVAGLCNVRDET